MNLKVLILIFFSSLMGMGKAMDGSIPHVSVGNPFHVKTLGTENHLETLECYRRK